MELKERKLFRRREWIVLSILFVLAVGLFLWTRLSPQGTVAVVEREGEVLLTKDLSQLTGPETVEVSGAATQNAPSGFALTIEFSPAGAQVISAACPDKTCQHVGMLTRAGESAVCLPARVVLRLEAAGGSEVDAETY